jgi:hypothetical protein
MKSISVALLLIAYVVAPPPPQQVTLVENNIDITNELRADRTPRIITTFNTKPFKKLQAVPHEVYLVQTGNALAGKVLQKVAQATGEDVETEVKLDTKEVFGEGAEESQVDSGKKKGILGKMQFSIKAKVADMNGVRIVKNGRAGYGDIVTKVRIDTPPYEFKIRGFSKDNEAYLLPAKFSVGVNVNPEHLDTLEARKNLITFVTRLGYTEGIYFNLEPTIEGILEEAIRGILKEMTAEEIIKMDSSSMEVNVKSAVEEELSKFGLFFSTAQFSRVIDDPDHQGTFFQKYGSANRQKTDYETQLATEKINRKMQEEIAKEQLEKEAALEQVRVNKEARLAEITNKKALDDAEREKKHTLETTKINEEKDRAERKFKYDKELAEKKASLESLTEQERLQKTFCEAQHEALLAKERKDKLVALQIEAEMEDQRAKITVAKARAEAEADAIKADAEVSRVEKMIKALGGDVEMYYKLHCAMTGLTLDLAKTGADTVRGMNPVVKVFAGGSSGGVGAGNQVAETLRAIKLSNSFLKDEDHPKKTTEN